MYGLVNQAITDLVVSTEGEATWKRIREIAGVDSARFMAGEDYDDAVTYRLVEAAAQVLDTDETSILEAFGRHWILFTGSRGWGPTLDAAGSTVREVLHNLNELHVRVTTTMPLAKMPSFIVNKSTDEVIEVEYISGRVGLSPMVLGLLRGLGERLDDPHDVAEISAGEIDGRVRHIFELRSSVAAVAHSVG